MTDPRNLTVDRALQTVGGILLLITMSIAGWTLLQVVNHEGRIIRVETNADNSSKTVEEVKSDVKSMNTKLDHLIELVARKAP